MASPSPVPSPGGLVVKNGSNSLAWVSCEMPGPLSATWSTTERSLASARVVTVIRRGVGASRNACCAFVNRLITT